MVEHMIKKQISSILLIILLIIASVTNVFASGTKIELSNHTCKQGNEVDVELTMPSNSGVISVQLELEFDDDNLSLIKVTDGGILGTSNHSDKLSSPYVLSWENDVLTENLTTTGKIATLKFEVSASAKIDEYSIKIVRAEVLDKDIRDVEYDISNGSITVEKAGNGGSGGSGGGGGGGGGSVKPPVKEEEKEETEPVTPAEPETEDKPVTSVKFSDVKENDWYYDYVTELAEKGIVSGDGNGGFAPNDNVTREQFLKMIIEATDIEANESENTFADVADDWYKPYVLTAKNLGIVNGVTDTMFGIGQKITRQDMAVMITRTIEKLGITIEENEVDSFADNHKVTDYATEAVEYMKSIGLIEGYNNEYRPQDNLTRAEAAKVISELLKLI